MLTKVNILCDNHADLKTNHTFNLAVMTAYNKIMTSHHTLCFNTIYERAEQRWSIKTYLLTALNLPILNQWNKTVISIIPCAKMYQIHIYEVNTQPKCKKLHVNAIRSMSDDDSILVEYVTWHNRFWVNNINGNTWFKTREDHQSFVVCC